MPSSARAIAHLAYTLRASLHVARRAAIGTHPACSPPSVAPKPTGNTIPTGAENRINAARDRSVLRAPSELPSTRLAQRARKISPNIRSGPVGGLRCYTRLYIVGFRGSSFSVINFKLFLRVENLLNQSTMFSILNCKILK